MKLVSGVLFLVALLGMAGHMAPGATMRPGGLQLAESASLYDPYTSGATACPQEVRTEDRSARRRSRAAISMHKASAC